MTGQNVTAEKLQKALDADRTGRVVQDPRFAVVAPVVFECEEPYLLVEVRAAGIAQAGDPCFPGGKIEAGESPAQAASREMEEELGIFVPAEDFLGELPEVYTYLGRRTRVYVCAVAPEKADRARVNPDEVSVLLKVPVSQLLKDPFAMKYPFGGHVIWGMTAGAVRRFCKAWEKAERL